jgi:hypothetical protein
LSTYNVLHENLVMAIFFDIFMWPYKYTKINSGEDIVVFQNLKMLFPEYHTLFLFETPG